MSRKLLIMAAVMVFLAVLSAAEQILVRRATDDAIEKTQEIMTDIRASQLEEGKEKAHALDKAWDREAKWLELMVDHSSTDEVRYALSRLLAALEGEDRAGALIYAGELEGALEHVMERQALSPENIL